MLPALRMMIPALGLILLAGCAPQGQTTVITQDDFSRIVDETARNLRESDFLAHRGPNSPPISITLDKVLNLTSDIIPEARQWMFVMKIQGAMPLQQLANEKNLHFQVAPERLRKLRDAGFAGAGSNYLPPTHILTATFMSATRVRENDSGYVERRAEQYQLEYQIVDLRTSAIVWHSAVEYSREAVGKAID